jgi:primase-polymerase (primpol)-like protein
MDTDSIPYTVNNEVPDINKPLAENIPAELKDSQWVNWRYEWRHDRNGEWKLTKVPRTPHNTAASHGNPETWADFESVLIHAEESSGKRGIGRVFSTLDTFCGVDFDNCLTESGQLKEWAKPWVSELRDREAYIEVSPSGTGLKAIVKAALPGNGRRRKIADGEIEVYDRLRFFTFTGEVYDA